MSKSMRKVNAKLNMAFILTDIAETYVLEAEQYIKNSYIDSTIKDSYYQAKKALHTIVMSIKDLNDATVLGEIADEMKKITDSVMLKNLQE